MIAAKEATMKKLKETLSKALNSFEGKELTVEQKKRRFTFLWRINTFNSGSYSVGAEGKSSR
jgi:chemotaxis protein MotB